MEFINFYNILILVLIAILVIIYNLNKKLRKHDSQILTIEKDLNIQYEMISDLLDENDGFEIEHIYNEKQISNSQEKIILDFQNYLIKNKYSEFTPSGNPSTVYDYSKSRLPKICKRENITLQELADNISKYVKKYDIGGENSDFGAKSNRAYINALKCFQKFNQEIR